jgi:isopenicillin N synthase-like dioxygenase
MEDEDFIFSAPPPGPPPLLSEDQMIQLARQGWLIYNLPEDLAETVTELFTLSTNFFKLQNDEKVKLYPAKSRTEFGYYPVPGEKEYITFRCRVHTASESHPKTFSQPEELEDTTARAWQQCGLLLFRILCDIARWSHLDLSVWNSILDGTLTMPESEEQATYTLLRLFRYLPTTGVAEFHTDLGLLTICIGDRSGLEVLDRTATTEDTPIWISPPGNARTATILVGQTLRALSEDVFNAGVHRVVGNSEGRKSAVFALRHSTRHDVDFSLFGGEGRVKATEFWRFIKVGKVNVNTIKEQREAQRLENAARKSSGKSDYETNIGHG